MAVARMPQATVLGRWFTQGAIWGIIAGITFIAFEIILATILNSQPVAPLRAISAILLGSRALTGGYPATSVVVVGLAVHFGLSLVFGAIFGLGYGTLLALRSSLARSSWLIILVATLYGFLLWPVNFYLIAPAAGWRWFPQANLVVQFFAHTFFFGTALGGYLWSRHLERLGGELEPQSGRRQN